MPKPYTLTFWKGSIPVYNCTLCPFDTMSQDAFWKHWIEKHSRPEVTTSGVALPPAISTRKEEPSVGISTQEPKE